jgi:hypothetical protein
MTNLSRLRRVIALSTEISRRACSFACRVCATRFMRATYKRYALAVQGNDAENMANSPGYGSSLPYIRADLVNAAAPSRAGHPAIHPRVLAPEKTLRTAHLYTSWNPTRKPSPRYMAPLASLPPPHVPSVGWEMPSEMSQMASLRTPSPRYSTGMPHPKRLPSNRWELGSDRGSHADAYIGLQDVPLSFQQVRTVTVSGSHRYRETILHASVCDM